MFSSFFTADACCFSSFRISHSQKQYCVDPCLLIPAFPGQGNKRRGPNYGNLQTSCEQSVNTESLYLRTLSILVMQRPKPSYSEKPTKNSADPSSSAARHIMQALDCQEARRDTEELQQYKSDFLEEQAPPCPPARVHVSS